ncbi:MAG: UDP-N-acetylmuramoyl-L-alanyl-D-glutamate--2,6-diaminopimelate ligase [Gammaproteobacteria bacterium]|nr:MAG: UDP-N-acetylmuramoyl-L-alanyl-D-glutamate--2,6-diaminopimelate ligase [Gammaproteobacteria bacterium]
MNKVKLTSLLQGIAKIEESQDRELVDLFLDSRAIIPGALFIAVTGVTDDGHEYIAAAVDRGAIAVLCEKEPNTISQESVVTVVVIEDLKNRLGLIADRFFGSPSSRLKVIGVTGTNGKTTCTQLLAQALNMSSHDNSQKHCAVIGTLGNGFINDLEPTLNTTPDSITVHRLLAQFADAGAEYVCIEVSSHALHQGRVDGVCFSTAVFTNLSRDHLDYHGDMMAYMVSKSQLFYMPGLRSAVINVDDEYGSKLYKELKARNEPQLLLLGYAAEQGDIKTNVISTSEKGLLLSVNMDSKQIEIECPLFGKFNAMNIAVVLAVLHIEGYRPEEMPAIISQLHPVLGRMECFRASNTQPMVIVDYAHTPDALYQALESVREHCTGELWCVFGCGGDRDKGKRHEMGAIADQYADRVVVTNDNPRTEDPDTIINSIVAAMKHKPVIEKQRRTAIQYAVTHARPDDAVLVAGKGHENYQIIGTEKILYSDRQTVLDLLREAA